MKKFELTSEFVESCSGPKLFRIRALVAFGHVKAGDQGGYVEKEENLSQTGSAWVSGNAQVSGNARVSGSAWIDDNVRVSSYAWVGGNACVGGNAQVSGNARVGDRAWINDNVRVSGNACVSDSARVCGNAQVGGSSRVSGNAQISGDARVTNNADYATIKGFGRDCRNTTFFRCKDGKIRVVCGCFFGDLDEFREKVKETHGDGKMGREYLAIADLMEMHFTKE